MEYTIQDINSIIEGKLIGDINKIQIIHHIIFDSRKWFHPTGSIFICFKRLRRDGHLFIPELYQKGVRHFLISDPVQTVLFPEAQFILVDDTLKALQKWAIRHRVKYSPVVIGITGSNGKTIIKEWIYDLIGADKSAHKSPLSFNSQIGVALSVLGIDESHELAILEAGISRPGEMKLLEKLIRPTIGIFSHLGTAHNAGFKSPDEKLKEKAKLFKSVDLLIYQADQQQIQQYFTKHFNKDHLLSWSFDQKLDTNFHVRTNILDQGRMIIISSETQRFEFEVPFNDDASLQNAVHSFIAALSIGIHPEKIKDRMSRLSPIKMRLEIDAGANGCVLINDSYNADIDSFKNGLQVLTKQLKNKRKTIILSDFSETGISTQEFLAQLGAILKGINLYRILAIGKDMHALGNYVQDPNIILYFENTTELFEQLESLQFQNEDILIKGARNFKLDRIYNYLAQLAHEAILEMDLDALRNNINYLSRCLNPKTKIMAVVKASAYGSGSKELTKHLERCKIDYLAVAFIEEGVEIREAGIQLPILVLNPDITGIDKLIQYNLEPEIYSIDQFHGFCQFIKRGQNFPIHINIDTGMRRLGFTLEAIPELIEELKSKPEFTIRSIFSHLVASGTKNMDAFTLKQVALFNTAYEKISNSLNVMPLKHILNSNGIIRFPEYQFDLVRTGLALYGISYLPEMKGKLEKVHQLKARISQIKQVKKGQSVGYERAFYASKDMQIGTVNIGYADGIMRAAGNERFEVLINGKKVKIIGNICMDMFMVDLSEIPYVRPGDEVILFGQENPIEELAKVCGTIPYEILTRISNRIKRIYVHTNV